LHTGYKKGVEHGERVKKRVKDLKLIGGSLGCIALLKKFTNVKGKRGNDQHGRGCLSNKIPLSGEQASNLHYE